MKWQNKNILVAGMGRSGLSMLDFLQKNGAHIAAYDAELKDETKQNLKHQFGEIACFSGSLADALAHGFDILALSPGISCRRPEIEAFEAAGGVVLGDVEILALELAQQPDKVIAITGSNGKTTVTSLTGFLCQQCGLDTVIAGNIGMPVLEAYQKRQGKAADVWVLELSSFQLETTRHLNATVATVLNISEDHLERYDDLLDYAHAKDQIFQGSGVQVLNADDVMCRAMKRNGRPVKWVSLTKESDYWLDQASGRLKAGENDLIAAADLPLQGLHNVANVLVAFALCEAIGLSRQALLQSLPAFKGLPHRVEKIGEKNGIVFIDDSKGTNVGATCAAVAGLPGKIVLIAGGVGKGQDFSPLATALINKAIAVVLIGEDAQKIEAALMHTGIPLHHADTLQAAVQTAYSLAQPRDTVLLSPACASFDMFNGYEHRAQVFIEAFHAL